MQSIRYQSLSCQLHLQMSHWETEMHTTGDEADRKGGDEVSGVSLNGTKMRKTKELYLRIETVPIKKVPYLYCKLKDIE